MVGGDGSWRRRVRHPLQNLTDELDACKVADRACKILRVPETHLVLTEDLEVCSNGQCVDKLSLNAAYVGGCSDEVGCNSGCKKGQIDRNFDSFNEGKVHNYSPPPRLHVHRRPVVEESF